MKKVIPTIRNFYMNTIFLCKEKGILIGELEKKVGISPRIKELEAELEELRKDG